MINSKDYVKTNTPAVPDNSVQKLKDMLSADVASGQAIFELMGYIPISEGTQKLLFEVDRFCLIEIASWLLKYNWTLTRTARDTLKLALFATQDNP